jgi:hypothetical protein
MESKQQTAVEWLINEWPVLESNIPPRIIEQANQMFQEQIMKAYDDGAIDTMQEQEGLDISMDQNGEESGKYYKETYNNK